MGMKPSTRPVSIEQVRSPCRSRTLKIVYQWAKRVQTETVGWFQKNMPQALPKR
jgi:hypothetical protein